MARLTRMHLGDILVVPIQEELHDTAAEETGEAIIREAEDSKIKGVAIDISALDIVDSFLGRLLQKIATGLNAMGKEVIVVGIQPAVAISLVELGLYLEEIETAFELDAAIEKLRKKIDKNSL
ncbi:MAG: STAS domain-containing protein [candidate division WOR-3 bacterium]